MRGLWGGVQRQSRNRRALRSPWTKKEPLNVHRKTEGHLELVALASTPIVSLARLSCALRSTELFRGSIEERTSLEPFFSIMRLNTERWIGRATEVFWSVRS